MSVSTVTALVVLHLAVGYKIEWVVQPSVAAVTVPHLSVSDSTEREMAPYVWEMLGLCKAEAEYPRDTCEHQDETAHCQARQARRLPCDRERFMSRMRLYYQSGD